MIKDWLIDMHWLHSWNRWERYQVKFSAHNGLGKVLGTGLETWQRRSCQTCGYNQEKRVKG